MNIGEVTLAVSREVSGGAAVSIDVGSFTKRTVPELSGQEILSL